MNIRENVERVLDELGLLNAVTITAVDADRVWGWPDPSHRLLVHMTLDDWSRDNRRAAEHHHGTAISFRERDVRPALQVCLHPQEEQAAAPYFLEIDLDEFAPNTPAGAAGHAVEVIRNAVTRRKTDQRVIAALLDKRFAGREVVNA